MSDYIDFQSHTRFHPCLPNCSKEVAEEEIRKSKTKLEYILSKEINSISYPNGDYSARDINFSKEFGYNSGITVDYGFNSIHTDIFKLKRVSVNDTENMDEFIVKSSGLWAHIQR